MNFYIKNPDTSNIDQVISLYKDNRDTLGIPFSRIFERMLEDKNFLIIVDDNGTVAGFCGFRYKPVKKYYEIEHLCVDTKFRNNHLALRLLQYHLNFNYVNNLGTNLLSIGLKIPVVAYAVDGKDNNSFYDKFSSKFDIVPRKTKILRRYYLDIDRILNYGS